MKKMRYFLTHLVVVISYISFVSATCLAATYYVDKNHASASDANPGTQNLPWLTINKSAQTMLPGDMTYIRQGTYNEHVVTARSGTSTEGYIVFAAYPGENPILDGTGITVVGNLFIIDKSYVKLKGLEIRNFPAGNALWIDNCDHVEVSDCVVHDVEFGIGVAGGTHDFCFNRVEVYNFDYYGFDVSPTDGDCYQGAFSDCIAHSCRRNVNEDGFAIGHGTQHDFVFTRCEAHHVPDGFVFSSNDVTADRCTAHNADIGFKIWGDNINLTNCLSYQNLTSNMELDWDEIPGTTTLRNCTFINTQGDNNVAVENSSDSLHMYNCILAGGDNLGLVFYQRDAGNYRGDYNLFHIASDARMISVGYEDEFSLSDIESGSWTAYSSQDSHSVVVHEISEIFVDPANFDFHLLSTSSAVDTGNNAGAPNEDFEGDPRPQGGGYDIGADEYVAQETLAFLIYFPHIASNSVWETEICVINTSPVQSLSGNLRTYNDSGQEVSSTPVILAANGRREIIIGDELPNPSGIGYIIFESDSENVCGYTKFYTEGKYRVAIPAVSDINAGDIYMSHIASNTNWWTGN